MKVEFIYGGSFDPLHKGHVNLVKEVVLYVKQLAGGNVEAISFRFLPCATPALKKASFNSFSDRSEKLKSFFAKFFVEQKIELLVDEREDMRSAENGEKSYTIDSLKEMDNENNSMIRFLIVGADNFKTLDRWKNYRELANFCNLLVINRAKENLEDWMAVASRFSFSPEQDNSQWLNTNKKLTGRCYYLEISEVDISSTEIKEKMEAGQSVDDWLV